MEAKSKDEETLRIEAKSKDETLRWVLKLAEDKATNSLGN